MARFTARALLLATLMAPTLPHVAQACSLGIDIVGPTAWNGADGRGYDVFDSTVYYQPLGLRIESFEGSCPFYATVAATVTGGAAGTLAGPGTSLLFEVYRDASGAQAMRPAPLATQSEVLSGTASKDTGPVSFQVAYSIPALQIVAPGTYSGQITITAYEGPFGSGLMRAQKQVPLSITIPSIAEMSFAPGTFNATNKHISVDFGILNEGELNGITLHARGNGGYRISAASQNGGAMRQRDPLEQSEVPYTLRIDGKPVKLERSDAEAVVFQGITSAQGNPHRLDFRIGSVGNATAGDYEDTVYVTIMSLR